MKPVRDDESPTPSPETLRRILRSGILAPSAENRHFLRLRVLREGIELISTDVQSWPEQPHRKVLAQVSYGAVVENMTLEAATCGHAVDVHWFPEPARPELQARLQWTGRACVPDPLQHAIEDRHTNRRFYRRTAASSASLHQLSTAALIVPSAQLHWLTSRDERRSALRAMRIAESERFCRRALHHELFSAIRFDMGWQRTSAEGLPPAALEVEPPARPVFAALSRWPLMHAAATLGVHRALGMRAAELPCRLAPHLGLVSCALPDASLGAVELGRALQRVWLAATAEGLAFQPFAATLALSHQRAGNGWVSKEAQEAIRSTMHSWTAQRPCAMAMFFRIGFARDPRIVTGRPPVEQFISV